MNQHELTRIMSRGSGQEGQGKWKREQKQMKTYDFYSALLSLAFSIHFQVCLYMSQSKQILELDLAILSKVRCFFYGTVITNPNYAACWKPKWNFQKISLQGTGGQSIEIPKEFSQGFLYRVAYGNPRGSFHRISLQGSPWESQTNFPEHFYKVVAGRMALQLNGNAVSWKNSLQNVFPS